MPEALSGLRVIEWGTGPVTGMAGMILADFGAEVLRILPPRDRPLDSLNAAPMWARGKQDLVLDLNEQNSRDTLRELVACADVLLTNWRPGVLKRWDLDADALLADFDHLIYCHVSGFGQQGALADLPGYEHVVAAYAGRMMLFQGLADREGPVFSALQVGVHVATQAAVSGILAARLEQLKSGRGQLVETSILQGMLPYEMGGMIGRQFSESYQELLPFLGASPEPLPASLFYHPAQAGDGRWLQFGNLLPHLFDAFLIATDLVDILADPDYEPRQLLFTDPDKHEAFRERMLLRLQERPAADWMADFIEDGGIVATAYQTTREALTDPDIVANGHVVNRAGGVQLGPLARLSATPAVVAESAVAADDCVRRWRASPRPASTAEHRADKPLAGIRILDLSTIIAAPIGVSMLADMGADVIKVEQVGGDPFRSLLAGLGASRVNVGKRSISLDLKTDAGRDIVRQLAAQADVLVHNYRPGVPERLGIDYADVRETNPGIVYVQSNGYGPDGPSAHRPSTHPVPGAAMGGVLYQLGERVPASLQSIEDLRRWTARLMRANELNPDPNTGVVVASAVMLGLNARLQTGEGQPILVDMLCANAYANADDFLDYPGKPGRPLPDADLQGLSPTYRLYRCGDNCWIFLGLVSSREVDAFVAVLEQLDIDITRDDLLRPSDEHAAADRLMEIFTTRNAAEWQALLTAEGVACVQADRAAPADFWLEDEQVAANGFIGAAEHPLHGRYLRHAPLVTFAGQSGDLRGPPLAGQHNVEILEEAGYDSESIGRLHDAGVLWQS